MNPENMLESIPKGITSGSRLARERSVERLFRAATFVAAVLVLLLLGGVTVSLIHGGWPALAHFKLVVSHHRNLESGHREVRRAGADLRHSGDLDDMRWSSRCR